MATNERAKDRFVLNPNRYIEEAIRRFIETSPANRLESFGNALIFEDPLIGFADGNDPLFEDYKKIVHESHFTPREILARHLGTEASSLPDVSVISFVLPVNIETNRGNAREKEGPTLRWNHTRWHGQDFITKLSEHLIYFLGEFGIGAVAPDLTPSFTIHRQAGLVSNWSQRHMAYAAGLGTFSLSEGFITPKGQAMRCGSVVAAVKLLASPRPYANHLANCRFFATGKCGACIRRCPGGALSEQGHDKKKCFDIIFKQQKPWLDGAYGPGYIGQYAGCGLCQTGVPCEHGIPKI